MKEMHIRQNTSHASKKKIQEIAYFGIVKGLPNNIPQLTLPCLICLILKATHLICHYTVRTGDFHIGTCIQAYHILFNYTSIQGLTSDLNVIDSTSRYSYVFPTISKRTPVSLIKYIVGVFRSYVFHVLCYPS